jgi:catechol 2,3-dioxygenase-like lactoylglutathione lyase family enzyme
MIIQKASTTITTSCLVKTRTFYEQHLGAKAVFDCGWYVVLRLSGSAELCLMEPRDGAEPCSGGVTLNLQVTDADALHGQLTRKGISPVIPLEDHPWGDRGFGFPDPAGVMVYCYHDIEPSEAFRPYHLEPGRRREEGGPATT